MILDFNFNKTTTKKGYLIEENFKLTKTRIFLIMSNFNTQMKKYFFSQNQNKTRQSYENIFLRCFWHL